MSGGRRNVPVNTTCETCAQTFLATGTTISKWCPPCRKRRANAKARERSLAKKEQRRLACRGCGGPKPVVVGRQYCDDCHAVKYGRSAGQVITCTLCRIEQPGTMFRNHSRQCVTCVAERTRANHLRTKFGITVLEWDAIFDEQGRCCAICKRGLDQLLTFGVDHDHQTGKIRGILCTQCNYYFLGRFDDLTRLRSALDYLTDPPAGRALRNRQEGAA